MEGVHLLGAKGDHIVDTCERRLQVSTNDALVLPEGIAPEVRYISEYCQLLSRPYG